MSWIEVRATFPEPLLDPAPFLERFRAAGIENTQEDDSTLVGCLADVPGADRTAQALADDLTDAGAFVTVAPLEEQDWDEVWRRYFQPRRVGRRFLVRATWHEPVPSDLEIVLDPGQAFGTGDHPTTRLCLELLEEAEPRNKRVADVGCGSGILAVGAAKLGASEVVASDVDPVAVEVARENAARNGADVRFLVAEGVRGLFGESDLSLGQREWEQDEFPLREARETAPAEPDLRPSFDLVVSNIISAVLIRIAADVAAVLRPGGDWIVSGIIVQNWPDVRRAAEVVGLRLATEREEDGWIAARFAW